MVLTAEEQRIAERFITNLRAMDDETYGEVVYMVLQMAATMAGKYPRHKRPALRLVGGVS